MKVSIRNLLIGLVVVIVLAVVLLRGDQLVELAETVRSGAAIPLVAALLTQLAKYFSQSFAYSFAFEAVDERMSPRDTLPLVFGTFFMNTIAPSLNLAGTTLVVDDARRRGIDAGRATSAALLMQITIDSGFAVIMLIGFAILSLTVGLQPWWFLLGLLVIVLVGSMVCIMVLGRRRPALVLKVLRPIERLVNRIRAKFKKRPLDAWVERAVASFSEAAGLIARNPKTTAKAFGCSVVASVCELGCFALVGAGFGVFHPEALICGYVVATLFAMISFTPQGVGVVEAVVLVAFTSFGVSAAAGMAIALVYRGIVFWLPFLIGAVLIQRTKSFRMGAKRAVRVGSMHSGVPGAAAADRPSSEGGEGSRQEGGMEDGLPKAAKTGSDIDGGGSPKADGGIGNGSARSGVESVRSRKAEIASAQSGENMHPDHLGDGHKRGTEHGTEQR